MIALGFVVGVLIWSPVMAHAYNARALRIQVTVGALLAGTAVATLVMLAGQS